MRVYEQRKTATGITGLSIPYRIPNAATDRAQRAEAPTSGICEEDDCGYADDLGLLCWTLQDLQTCMDLLNNTFTEFGLNINIDKTKTMVINHCSLTEYNYPESIITLNGEKIDNDSNTLEYGFQITPFILANRRWNTELALPTMPLHKTGNCLQTKILN